MYRIDRNNYHQNPKNSNIQTPIEVSQFIFELLKDKIAKRGVILDPCCGQGSLLEPWERNDYLTYGVDISEENSQSNLIADFFTLSKKEFELSYFVDYRYFHYLNYQIKKPVLVLCNPPFNGYKGKLASEVWLDKIIELFGKKVPIALFVPTGFRLNLTPQSERYRKFEAEIYPAISSFIALPKNIFPNVTFHSEILIFNIKGLEPHYFYREETNHTPNPPEKIKG